MRLRCVKGADDKLNNHKCVVNQPDEYKGKWAPNYFSNNNPIHVEFGMGKGNFINTLGMSNPSINYIGFEKFTKVLVRALDQFDEDRNNIGLVRFDVEYIKDIFCDGEVDRIYLNFSDPWPKERHDKRRLTHTNFLKLYEDILGTNGEIHFKTDNSELFEFSLDELKKNNWEIKIMTRDLHNSEYLDGNIMTEYEQKFVEMGLPINKVVAKKPVK